MTATERPALRVVPPSTNGGSPPSHKVQKVGLGYVWERTDLKVTFRADYLRERSDEFTAEIVVETTQPGVPALLHQARMNLSSTRGRAEVARHLAGAGVYQHDEWLKLVEGFSIAVLRLERVGEPVVHVGRLPHVGRTTDHIERLLPAGKPTLWYGPQGSGKGWMSVAACVCTETGADLAGWKVRKGRALYLDWEDDAEALNLRVQAVACGLGVAPPDIAYRKCRKTLTRDIHAVMRHAAEEGATLIVVDSVGLAAGASGERGYDDVALAMFEVLRLLEPATVLCVDHLASAELQKRGQLAGKAFGSIYKMAEARAAWEIRAEQEAGAEETFLGFYHTKHNHSQKYPAMGFRLEFAPTDPGDPPAWVKVHRENVRASAGLRSNLPLMEQLQGLLLRTPMATAELADELDADETKIRVYLNRGKEAGKFAKLPDGRWAALAQGREGEESWAR